MTPHHMPCKSKIKVAICTKGVYSTSMIIRDITEELLQCAAEYPAVTILGPRQAGKTTLAQMTFSTLPCVSLEDPDIRLAAEADPRGFLGQYPDGVVLDEVQRLPALLSYIQGIVDKSRQTGRFILTGSHQPRLHEAISQSLAGRTAILSLWPFSVPELRRYKQRWSPYELITKGGFPRVHQENLTSRRFYNSYLQTYVERDVRAMLQLRSLTSFQQFLTLLAGRVGQIVNHAALANDVGNIQFTLLGGDVVSIALTTQKNTIFGRALTATLTSQVKLRN